MGIYIGLIQIDPSRDAKDNTRHNLPLHLLREALQWPAHVEVRVDDDPEHGWRVLALGVTQDGREVFAALMPLPEHEREDAETWLIRHARFL